MNLNRTARIAAALVISFAIAITAAAADKPGADKTRLIGTWTVVQGVYADGSIENELEMAFKIDAATMSNPMDDSTMPWTIDEKAKTISAGAGKNGMRISYRFATDGSLEFTEMTLTNDKATQIVGAKGTFKLLKLKKAA